MPKKNSSYLNQDLIILQKLLEFSKPGTYRKRISGYGLKETDFDKKSLKISKVLSRKIFRGRKTELLSQKFIREIKTKERGKLLGITPLGIVFLYHHSKPKKQSIRRISKILEYHLNNNFNRDRKKRFDIIETQLEKSNPENKIVKNLIKVLKDIQIFNESVSQRVFLLYEFVNTVPIVLEKYYVIDQSIFRAPEKTFPKRVSLNSGLSPLVIKSSELLSPW